MKKFKSSHEMYEYWINQSLKMKTRIAWMNIKSVCDQMEKDGVGITVYSVGNRLLKNELSPKTQSLWNNKDFHNYIQMRMKECRPNNLTIKVEELQGNDKLLEIIRDLKQENSVLRKIIERDLVISK